MGLTPVFHHELSVPAGSIELKLHDMVQAAKSSEHCTIKMAKENAAPRFSIF